jgi:virulence factor Mce-like protein
VRRLAPVVLTAAVALPGCGVVGGGGGSYTLTADFSRAVALYEGSRVEVMGADVGTVEDVAVDGDRIRVELSVRDDVPLPADVHAAIVPLTLIGERNIVLFPAWRPGDDRAADGDVIPPERTEVPVEPDEALEAFTELARAIDPETVRRLVTDSAVALEGHGLDLNGALRAGADVTSVLAGEADDLAEVATDLARLTDTLATREQQLGRLLDAFSQAAGVLAAERDAIQRFLAAVVQLSEEGELLLEQFGEQLPSDVATLAQVAMVVRVNIDSVVQLVHALPENSRLVIDAYDPARRVLRIRVNLTPDASEALQAALAPLGVQPCLEALGVVCE